MASKTVLGFSTLLPISSSLATHSFRGIVRNFLFFKCYLQSMVSQTFRTSTKFWTFPPPVHSSIPVLLRQEYVLEYLWPRLGDPKRVPRASFAIPADSLHCQVNQLAISSWISLLFTWGSHIFMFFFLVFFLPVLINQEVGERREKVMIRKPSAAALY